MKFATIEPAYTRWEIVDAKEPSDLYERLGLSGLKVEHGVVAPPDHRHHRSRGIAIVVDEFSLFRLPTKQHYFAIGSRLYAGNAVLYGYDIEGETRDLPHMAVPVFMTPLGIEGAIASGQIERPSMSVNGVQIWQWPDPAPFELRS
jgi:hypothetical protein